jgi:hypothetical protein
LGALVAFSLAVAVEGTVAGCVIFAVRHRSRATSTVFALHPNQLIRQTGLRRHRLRN